MTWEDILLKEESKILNALDSKKKKKLKKTLQAAEPTEYFGQDFTKLGELITMMKTLDLVKDDSKMQKKVKTVGEQNVDMVATASKLRKQYEQLYRDIREMIYPKSARSLREEVDKGVLPKTENEFVHSNQKEFTPTERYVLGLEEEENDRRK